MEETAKKESEEKKLKEKEQEKAPKLPAVPATQGLHGALQPKDMILNTKLPDSGSKSFFDNQILCAQFLRGQISVIRPFCPLYTMRGGSIGAFPWISAAVSGRVRLLGRICPISGIIWCL